MPVEPQAITSGRIFCCCCVLELVISVEDGFMNSYLQIQSICPLESGGLVNPSPNLWGLGSCSGGDCTLLRKMCLEVFA